MTSPHRLAVLVALGIVLALPTAGIAAPAATSDAVEDANEQVDRLDGEIDVAEDELTTFDQRLAALDDDLRAASEALSAAAERATDAQSAADRARSVAQETGEQLAATQDELGEKREQLAGVARDAYMHGGQPTGALFTALEGLSDADGAEELAAVQSLLEIVVVERSSVVEDTQRLVRRTVELTRAARTAQQQAVAEAAAADEAREEAARRNADVLALADEADRAIRAQQQELAELRSQRAEAALTADRLEQEARRAAEEAAAERALEEAAAEAQGQAEQADADEPETEQRVEDADVDVTTTSVSDGLVSVGGITVAASLAPDLEALLSAASADGIDLTGYGYRSPETTARMRIVNGCPDVDTSPASSCRVPTARPGESMHEQGLAVDFNYRGATICFPRPPSSCSGNPAFDWLRANAGRYGLQVLDTEAWHWSTNGR